MAYLIVTDWDRDDQSADFGRVTAYRREVFNTEAEAVAFRATMPEPYASTARVLERPTETEDVSRYFVDDAVTPTTLHHIPVPEPSASDVAATISIAPATFWPALRAAIPFAVNIPEAARPTGEQLMRDWLLDYIAALDPVALEQGIAAISDDPLLTVPGMGSVLKTHIRDRLAGASEIDRASKFMTIFATLIGLTSAQTDAVFIAANSAADELLIGPDVTTALTALAAE